MLEEFRAFKTLVVQQDGRLLRVMLNRPESLNAVGGEGIHHELAEFFYLARHDSSIGAILLTGAGRAFCAGGDIKGMAEYASTEQETSDAERSGRLLGGSKTLVMNMLESDRPVVCAVQGYAMGIGATIALCSDVVIAAEDAIIADNHVHIGVVPGDGGTLLWPLLLPLGVAKYYLMTGDRLTGAEAARMGLILKAVPADELMSAAEEIAMRLANGPTLAIRWTKTAVNKVLLERANLLFDVSLALSGATYMGDDHREATKAWVERRPVEFRGR
jgi:enoyl-CoA hydratase